MNPIKASETLVELAEAVAPQATKVAEESAAKLLGDTGIGRALLRAGGGIGERLSSSCLTYLRSSPRSQSLDEESSRRHEAVSAAAKLHL